MVEAQPSSTNLVIETVYPNTKNMLQVETLVFVLVALVAGQRSLSCPLRQPAFLQLYVDDLGCWKDTASRAIPILEGQEADLLTGAYNTSTRNDPVRQCAMAAIRRGYTTSVRCAK